MSFEFETKVFKLTSEKRKILFDGESLLKKQRELLKVEEFLDVEVLSLPSNRIEAETKLESYRDQLVVEKNFYSEFHNTFLSEIKALAVELDVDERNKFLERSLPGLIENDSIRSSLNNEKSQIVSKFLRIIAIFNNHHVQGLSPEGEILLDNPVAINEVIGLSDEINTHLDNQNSFAKVQRTKSVDGQNFLGRLKNLFLGLR